MPSLLERVRLCVGLAPRRGVAALAVTLPHASSEERPLLVDGLLALARPVPGDAALRVIAEQWHLLDDERREWVLQLFESAGPAPLQVLLAAGDDLDRRLGAMVGVTWVQERAGRLDAARDDFAADPRERATAAAADAALAIAAAEYPAHRVPGLIESIARLSPRPGPAVRAWLEDDRQAGHLALRSILRSMPAPEMARLGVTLLSFASTRRIVIERLMTLAEPGDRAAALASGTLLRTGRRASAARLMAHEVGAIIGDESTLRAMPEHARRGAVGWLRAGPRDDARAMRLRVLTDRLADPSPLVRFDAAAALSAETPTRESDALLADFALDAEEPIAALAAGAIAGARSPARQASLRPVLARLTRSPHARVRAIASKARRLNDPWFDDGRAGRWACPSAARRALALDQAAFCDELRRRVSDGPRELQLHALALAERLSLCDAIEPQLLRLSTSDDDYLAGKAVRLLARVPTDSAGLALRAALCSPMARVRASAIESLPRTRVMEKELFAALDDPSARARANAARALLSIRPHNQRAARALLDMLSHERADLRRSGLWAVERLARRGPALMEALTGRVADLARSERDPIVAARAARCSRRLLAEMRLGWSRGSNALVTPRAIEPEAEIHVRRAEPSAGELAA